MNRGKKIQVNASSLFDLKAELVRKQEEFKKCKLNNERPSKPLKKVTPWNKQNKGVADRAKADRVVEKEEEDALLRSRKALEAKAKLYDKMTKDLPDEETGELYMVDFQRKMINSVKERKLAQSEDADRDKDDEDAEEEIAATCSDDEWVDYVDSLGRSRRCLKKDLDYLKEVDRSLSQRDSSVDVAAKWTNENDLLSEDMKMQIQRQKWEDEEMEKDEEDENSTPIGPIHYQTIQQQEVRNHGVGYFAFSTDEEERQRQLNLLENLRKQTENQKSTREKLKDKRKMMLQARLAKVQQRKNVILPPEEEEATELDNIESVEEKEIESPQNEQLAAEKPSTLRPWDKGKIGLRNEHFNKPQAKKQMTGDEWIDQQRKNRSQEFAPPDFYYNQRKTNAWPSSSFNLRRQNLISNPNENVSNDVSWKPETAPLPDDVTNIPLPDELPQS